MKEVSLLLILLSLLFSGLSQNILDPYMITNASILVVILVGLVTLFLYRKKQLEKKKDLKYSIDYYNSKIDKIKNEIKSISNSNKSGKDITSNKKYFSELADKILKEFNNSNSKIRYSEEYLVSIRESYQKLNNNFNTLKHYVLVDRKVNLQNSMLKSTKSSLNFKIKRAKKEFDLLKKEFPNLTSTYLDFKGEDYYKQTYSNQIVNTIEMAQSKVKSKNFRAANSLYFKFESLKNEMDNTLQKFSSFRSEIKSCEENISYYEKEIKVKGNTLYTKTYKKVKHDYVESSTVRKWNNLQSKIKEYESVTKKKSDVILKSSKLIPIINELKSVKRMALSDIDRKLRLASTTDISGEYSSYWDGEWVK